jgi:hypothetical protein
MLKTGHNFEEPFLLELNMEQRTIKYSGEGKGPTEPMNFKNIPERVKLFV